MRVLMIERQVVKPSELGRVDVGKCWQEGLFSLQGRMVNSVWISCQAGQFLGWHLQRTIEIFCLRGSWLTTHAHHMPWLGQPTASWLQAVIGEL